MILLIMNRSRKRVYIFITLALAGVEQERHCGGQSYAKIEVPPDGKVKIQLN